MALAFCVLVQERGEDSVLGSLTYFGGGAHVRQTLFDGPLQDQGAGFPGLLVFLVLENKQIDIPSDLLLERLLPHLAPVGTNAVPSMSLRFSMALTCSSPRAAGEGLRSPGKCLWILQEDIRALPCLRMWAQKGLQGLGV